MPIYGFSPKGTLQLAWLTEGAGNQAENCRLTGLRNQKTAFRDVREPGK